MRFTYLLILLLAACSDQASQQPADLSVDTGTYAGQGRDRLCLAKSAQTWTIGVVTYGGGDFNCTFRGKVRTAEHGMLAEAAADPACKLVITPDGSTLRIEVPDKKACEYYCGPGATLADRSFKHDNAATPAVDFAGEPLC